MHHMCMEMLRVQMLHGKVFECSCRVGLETQDISVKDGIDSPKSKPSDTDVVSVPYRA